MLCNHSAYSRIKLRNGTFDVVEMRTDKAHTDFLLRSNCSGAIEYPQWPNGDLYETREGNDDHKKCIGGYPAS